MMKYLSVLLVSCLLFASNGFAQTYSNPAWRPIGIGPTPTSEGPWNYAETMCHGEWVQFWYFDPTDSSCWDCSGCGFPVTTNCCQCYKEQLRDLLQAHLISSMECYCNAPTYATQQACIDSWMDFGWYRFEDTPLNMCDAVKMVICLWKSTDYMEAQCDCIVSRPAPEDILDEPKKFTSDEIVEAVVEHFAS